MTAASTEEITVALRVLHHWNTSRSIHELDLARLQKMVPAEQARLHPDELACTIIRQMLNTIELRLVHRKLTSTVKEETESGDPVAVLSNGASRALSNGRNGHSELNHSGSGVFRAATTTLEGNRITQADLLLLIENCTVAFKDYKEAADKTHRLLSELKLPFAAWQRSEIVKQRIRQSEAYAAYSNAREVMYAALRFQSTSSGRPC